MSEVKDPLRDPLRKKTEWTEELEKQLKYLGECAQGYSRMYKMDILRYSSRQQKWTTGSIGAGVLGGALLTLSLSLGLSQSQVMVIISALLSFGASVCQGFLYQIDYATILADLKRQAAKYSGLQNNIKRQLSLPRHKREKAENYHYWITTSYDQLGETSLNIHPDTVEMYRKICKESNLPFPDESADDAKIVVHVDSQREPPRESLHTGPELMPHLQIPPQVSSPVPLPDQVSSPMPQDEVKEALGYTDPHMRYELERLARLSRQD